MKTVEIQWDAQPGNNMMAEMNGENPLYLPYDANDIFQAAAIQQARKNHCASFLWNTTFLIGFIVPICLSLPQLADLTAKQPPLIVYVAIEIAIYGTEMLLSLLMICCTTGCCYMLMNKFREFLGLVVLGNFIFGATQFWNPEIRAYLLFNSTASALESGAGALQSAAGALKSVTDVLKSGGYSYNYVAATINAMIAVRLFILGCICLVICCVCCVLCCTCCCNLSEETHASISSYGQNVPLVGRFMPKPRGFEGGRQEEIEVQSIRVMNELEDVEVCRKQQVSDQNIMKN